MAENKSVIFNVQTPETALVTGDSNMLTTVVRNLLNNAVKFSAEGGTVTLNISSQTDSDGRDGAHPVSTKYAISIADTGTGMNSEQIQDIFRLDKQQSVRGTGGEQGSGLGLIICREFLQKHGTTLNVESEEGKGSRFRFEVNIA